MKLYKKMMFLILFLFSGFAFASPSFSLQVVQKDGSENVVYEASYLIEQVVLDYFYDHAYIVSNSPIIIQKRNADITGDLQKSFDAAQEGSLDLIIQMIVTYNLIDSSNPEEALLNNIQNIEWKALSLSDSSVIVQGQAVPAKTYRNDDDGLIYFANELASKIKIALETKGGNK
ncbi:MAG: hypothetical protein KBT21_03195 [Treponema sp.]|nr:hypothetical protein [Candidatus Treponema merdequi]